MAAGYQADSSGIVIGMHELEKLRKRFADVREHLTTDTELADAIGHQQETSAVRRIRETKRTPAGKRWAPWSKAYAKTRKPNHSLLVSKDHLAESITHVVISPHEVQVGSNLAYAGAHLYGVPKRNLPARPYLDTEPGFSDPRDRAEIREIMRALFEKWGL